MKEIKWCNKELPGISQDELEKLTYKKLVSMEKALAMTSDPEILKKRGKSISKTNKGRVNDMTPLQTKEARDKWRESIDIDKLHSKCRDMAKKRRKPVEVFLNKESLGIFESCLKASKELPLSLASINNLANPNHKTKQVRGYTVKYVNND